jgi:hypothetical protein
MLARAHVNRAIGERSSPLWLRIGFWGCVAIALAVVVRRVITLAFPPKYAPPAAMAGLDAAFASHAALTLAHILPAVLFVLLCPLAFSRRFAHAAWLDWLIFPLGLVVGVTAYAMSAYTVGGWVERSAVLVFNSVFLYSLLRAYLYLRRGDWRLRHRWLTRAIVVLLGIATTRPVMGVFFATSRLTHLTARDFFGYAFWIGFSINLLVVELWLRTQRFSLHTERLAMGRK